MQGAPGERGEQKGDEDALALSRVLEQPRERVAGRALGRWGRLELQHLTIGPAGDSGSRLHVHLQAAVRRDVGAADALVGAQVVGRVTGVLGDAHRGPGSRSHLDPDQAGEVGVGQIADLDPPRVADPHLEGQLEAHDRQSADARREVDLGITRAARGAALSVDDHRESSLDLLQLEGDDLLLGQVALAEGQKLGLVEDVQERDPVARDAYERQVVDRVLSKRVGARRRRAQQGRERRQQGDQEQDR